MAVFLFEASTFKCNITSSGIGSAVALVRAINTERFHNKVSLRGIVLDVTGAGEAVAEIRHIKERVRSVVNSLPFSLNEKLEVWLVKYAVSRIVLAPTCNSLNHISPR